MKFLKSLMVAAVLLIVTMVTGWIANIVWLLNYTGEAGPEIYVAIAGAFLPPLGALHGLMTLF